MSAFTDRARNSRSSRGKYDNTVGNRDAARGYWLKAMEADPGSQVATMAEEKIRNYYPAPYPGF